MIATIAVQHGQDEGQGIFGERYDDPAKYGVAVVTVVRPVPVCRFATLPAQDDGDVQRIGTGAAVAGPDKVPGIGCDDLVSPGFLVAPLAVVGIRIVEGEHFPGEFKPVDFARERINRVGGQVKRGDSLHGHSFHPTEKTVHINRSGGSEGLE